MKSAREVLANARRQGARPYRLLRDVKDTEGAWFEFALGETELKAGLTVYKFTGPTYGAVREFAATLDAAGNGPFFELSYDMVEELPPGCSGQHPDSENDESGLVETVEGPVSTLREWGRNRGSYPDNCPGPWHAHYTLAVRGEYIAQTSTPQVAQLFRDIALTLNAAHENGSGVGKLV